MILELLILVTSPIGAHAADGWTRMTNAASFLIISYAHFCYALKKFNGTIQFEAIECIVYVI